MHHVERVGRQGLEFRDFHHLVEPNRAIRMQKLPEPMRDLRPGISLSGQFLLKFLVNILNKD
jgi:hypothetical protein